MGTARAGQVNRWKEEKSNGRKAFHVAELKALMRLLRIALSRPNRKPRPNGLDSDCLIAGSRNRPLAITKPRGKA
jgi:hypothetical protein